MIMASIYQTRKTKAFLFPAVNLIWSYQVQVHSHNATIFFHNNSFIKRYSSPSSLLGNGILISSVASHNYSLKQHRAPSCLLICPRTVIFSNALISSQILIFSSTLISPQTLIWSKTLITQTLATEIDKENYYRFANELNAICRILSDHRNPHDDVEAALDGCSIKIICPDFVAQVLKRCCNLWVAAYKFFTWAGRRPDYKHSIESVNIMMDILGKGRQFDSIWDLLTNQNHNLPVTHKTFIVIIKRYAKAQLPQNAIEAFKRMSKFGCKPSIQDFNALLSVLCENKFISHAHEFYDQVKDEFPLNTTTYNILIGSWGELGDVDQALRLFQEIAKQKSDPDIVVYNTLLSSICKGGQLEEAYRILNLMKVEGPVPNVTTYNIFVHAHCEMNEVDEALKVLGRMKRYGLVPDVVTYSPLIFRLCKMEKVDDAYRVLDEMSYKGITPDIQSYNTILGVHCKLHKVKKALRLLRRMDDDGCIPDVNTYNMLIKMLIKVGCYSRAVEVWNGMEEKGFYPSVTTYSVLIHGFCKRRKYEEACEYFEEMIDEGIPPYPCTCELLKKCFLRRKQKITVQILAEKMRKSTSCSIQELSKIMELKYLTEKQKPRNKFMGIAW